MKIFFAARTVCRVALNYNKRTVAKVSNFIFKQASYKNSNCVFTSLWLMYFMLARDFSFGRFWWPNRFDKSPVHYWAPLCILFVASYIHALAAFERPNGHQWPKPQTRASRPLHWREATAWVWGWWSWRILPTYRPGKCSRRATWDRRIHNNKVYSYT